VHRRRFATEVGSDPFVTTVISPVIGQCNQLVEHETEMTAFSQRVLLLLFTQKFLAYACSHVFGY